MERAYGRLEWPDTVPDIIRLLQEDGNRLRVFRVAMGWSQTEVAKEFGVSMKTWSCWERGEYKIPGPAARSVALEIQACLTAN